MGKHLVYYDKTSIKSHKEFKRVWVKKIYEKKQKIDKENFYNISEELIVFNCTNKTWTKAKWSLYDLQMNVVYESEYFNPFKPDWNMMWGGVTKNSVLNDLYLTACTAKSAKK